MATYDHIIRPLLFRLGHGDAEVAHDSVLAWLHRLGFLLRPLPIYSPEGAARTVFGITFPNPVGLAAGIDKNAKAVASWHALGFGFVEIGTITRYAQRPNQELPRLVRLPESRAIINRLGFPNVGADAIAEHLTGTAPRRIPVGLSLGKSRATPMSDVVEDYVVPLRMLYRHGDYFVINVSSPNTTGLRTLQDRAALEDLLAAVMAEAGVLAEKWSWKKPVLVKIAPDLSESALGELLEVCLHHRIDGLVATNTTVSRTGVLPTETVLGQVPGGLSGLPFAELVRAVVKFVVSETEGALPVIGVGGVLDADGAAMLVDAGASLVQIGTGLIYRGPTLVRSAVRRLAAHRSRTSASWSSPDDGSSALGPGRTGRHPATENVGP